MDNLSALNLIIGFFSPILISVITRPGWDPRLKTLVMVGVSVVVGFLTALFSDQLNLEDVTSAILTTMVASITAYYGVFKPSGVSPKIELATSPERKVYKDDQTG
jgi:hypothetical protein